jgi:hypothetical protein
MSVKQPQTCATHPLPGMHTEAYTNRPAQLWRARLIGISWRLLFQCRAATRPTLPAVSFQPCPGRACTLTPWRPGPDKQGAATLPWRSASNKIVAVS